MTTQRRLPQVRRRSGPSGAARLKRCGTLALPRHRRPDQSRELVADEFARAASATGYVAARIVECTFILVGLLRVLTIVTLRQTATGADVGALPTIAKTLPAIHNWTFLLGPGTR